MIQVSLLPARGSTVDEMRHRISRKKIHLRQAMICHQHIHLGPGKTACYTPTPQHLEVDQGTLTDKIQARTDDATAQPKGNRRYPTPGLHHPPRLVHGQTHPIDGPRLVANKKQDGLGHLERRDGRCRLGGSRLERMDGSAHLCQLLTTITTRGDIQTHANSANPSSSHASLCPLAIVFPMPESIAPGSTALHLIPSFLNRQATFFVAPIYHIPSAPPLHNQQREKNSPTHAY